MSVFFAYHVPSFTYPEVPAEGLFGHLTGLVQAAEDAGFDHVTVMDHFYQIRGVGPETEPMLEAYTTLGALAAVTRRIPLGTLVTGVTYRNPARGARATPPREVPPPGGGARGRGPAGNAEAPAVSGFGFPPIGERMDRL